VFAWQVFSSRRTRTRSRHASGLAAEGRLPLVDGDRESALGQFVGGAEAADAATDYRDGVLWAGHCAGATLRDGWR
jgi:hypothetical protein